MMAGLLLMCVMFGDELVGVGGLQISGDELSGGGDCVYGTSGRFMSAVDLLQWRC